MVGGNYVIFFNYESCRQYRLGFQQEYRLLRRLHHVNIVHAIDYFQENVQDRTLMISDLEDRKISKT